MGNPDKLIAIPPPAEAASPGSRPVEARQPGRTQADGGAPAPQLDRLIDELEAALGAALTDGAAAPAPSPPPRPTGDAAQARHGREPAGRQESPGGGEPPEGRSFDAVRDGDHWAVGLPESEADAEAQGRAGARAAWRPDGRRLRQAAIACALLVPLGIGAVALTFVPPGGQPTPGGEPIAVEGEAAPQSDGLSASIGDKGRDASQWAIGDDGDSEPQLRQAQEPVTPRLVKTVPVREPIDKPLAAVPPPALPALGEPGEGAPGESEPGSESAGR